MKCVNIKSIHGPSLLKQAFCLIKIVGFSVFENVFISSLTGFTLKSANITLYS